MFPLPVLPSGRLEQRFSEMKPAYNPAEAVTEANRCLYCVDAPCIKACPTGIDIPNFIHKISTGNTTGAARTILKENLLGASCARVCPVEVLCAGACVYNAWSREPIAIGRLQRFAIESALASVPMGKLVAARKPPTGKKVALIGTGPASLTAAGLLALEGHQSVLYEKKAIPGGLNTLGIAPYKQSGQQALQEIDWIFSLGDIELRSGVEVVAGEAGQGQVSAQALLEEYDAVFLGLGLGPDSALGVPGEVGDGVWGAVELIERIKAAPKFSVSHVDRALVIGGGNTAIDIAHELKLLGLSEVAMVYRRSAKNMSGYEHELARAREHGVRLIENRVVSAFHRDGAGKLTGATLSRAENGRAVGGGEEHLSCELVALAIGQATATSVAGGFTGVQVDQKGRVVVDPQTHRTGHARVWSGGDCVNGGKEVVNAVQEAKIAVRDMIRALGTK
ncbi:FAD-dependent oxidoreductase [Vitiosangium sp. GDMCC 1.1324]|uniref:FAD-dependent oxidoreductase n=1 Tax=Vitiosangium sp. (strain GDMCC 1.1324) TaxID=2138576 RepID=UPI000D3DB6AA|nr:FAD-dependent oxidoreductase [Vitiosangium sp. GDMCC 1.1324]PTL80129.1 glutamate synthase [Vitiosangium sp. GDMCC 1.1324]